MSLENRARKIANSLYDLGMIKTWYRDRSEGWILVSGLWSPFYIQLRALCSYPSVLREIGEAMSQLLSEEVPNVTRVLGIAMAGIPIAVATSLMSSIPAAFTRKSNEGGPTGKETKYGEHYFIEGELVDNDFLVLIDDVVTKFDTKMQAVSQVQQEINERRLTNVNCNDVAVVLDREQGASQTAKSHKVSLHSLIRFRSQALPWLAAKMSPLEWQVIDDYLEHPDKYQDPNLQQELKQEASKRNAS